MPQSCHRHGYDFAVVEPREGAADQGREARGLKQLAAWDAYLAEGLGTFLFFFAGITAGYALAGDSAAIVVGVALAHGLALAVMVSALGAVSGGHFNPAVTFGLWMAGKIDSVKAAAYVVVQLVAALLAAAVSFYIVSGNPEIVSTSAVPALAADEDLLRGIVAEAVATMGLLVAVFGTAVDKRAPKLGGLAIGIAVTAGILAVGPLTGGALNPARWFGPALFAFDWTNALVWIIGPLLGAGIVGAVYRYLILPGADEPTAA
jgi:MIP family channel proteins